MRWKTTRGTPSREHAIDPHGANPHGRALTFCGRPVPHSARANRVYVDDDHIQSAPVDACVSCGLTRRDIVEALLMPLCLAAVGCTICREQILIREETKARREQMHAQFAYYRQMAPWTPSWTLGISNYS